MTSRSTSDRIAEVAREIQSRESVAQAADEIAHAAHELLSGSAGAGITMVLKRREVETAAATADVVREGDRLQYEMEQGPCLDAAWEHEQVYSSDLATDERWPDWGPRVVEELGVRSILCTQLFTHEDQLGALNAYAVRRDAFDDEDRDTARLLAAHGAVAVAAAREVETLKVAVDRRTTIGKALGMLMARYGLDDEQAMSVLRRLSSHENRKLYDVAVDVTRECGLPGQEPGQ